MVEGGPELTHFLWGRLFQDGPAMGLVMTVLFDTCQIAGRLSRSQAGVCHA